MAEGHPRVLGEGRQEVTPGDILVLRDGREVEYVKMDDAEGWPSWPIVQEEDGTTFAVDPAAIEGGTSD